VAARRLPLNVLGENLRVQILMRPNRPDIAGFFLPPLERHTGQGPALPIDVDASLTLGRR